MRCGAVRPRRNPALGIAYISLAALGVTVSNAVIKRLAGTVDALLAMGIRLLFGGLLLVLAASFTELPSTTDGSIQFALVLLALAFRRTGPRDSTERPGRPSQVDLASCRRYMVARVVDTGKFDCDFV